MTWKVKWTKPDGEEVEIICDDPSQVRRDFDEQKAKGFEPRITDHMNRPMKRDEF